MVRFSPKAVDFAAPSFSSAGLAGAKRDPVEDAPGKLPAKNPVADLSTFFSSEAGFEPQSMGLPFGASLLELSIAVVEGLSAVEKPKREVAASFLSSGLADNKEVAPNGPRD